MARIERFEDIEAWKAARERANFVYDLTDKGRFARDFGLRDQIRSLLGLSHTLNRLEVRGLQVES